MLLYPQENNVLKYIVLKLQRTRGLDFKRLRRPLNPDVMEVGWDGYILEGKLPSYISMSCPHLQPHRPKVYILHWYPPPLLLQLILPQGTKHNYSIVPQCTVCHILHISAREKTQCCVGAYGIMMNML